MAFIENSTRFCVFCYRSDNYSINILDKSTNFYLFLKLVGRFNGERDNERDKQMHFNQLGELSLSQILGCCEGCLATVNGFCDIYHQYKCLEMQLEWKIEKLVNIIKLANRVPSRVSQVNKALQIKQTKDNKEVPEQNENERLKVVRTFRHCFAKRCRRRLVKCQPRVLISKIPITKPAEAGKKILKHSSNEDHIPEVEAPSTTEHEEATFKNSTVHFGSLKINSESGLLNDPSSTIVSFDDISQEAAQNEQKILFEDTVDDNDDSASSHDFNDDDDDPLNSNDFSDADTQEPYSIVSLPNPNNLTHESLIQTKLEVQAIPIPEETSSQTAAQSIPPPPPSSSLIIENVFTNLPLPLPEVLSKTSLCKICKKHFISEEWLTKHIRNDHTKTTSMAQQPVNIKPEAGDLIETCIEKDKIAPVPSTSSNQRYSLRERKSAVKSLEELESDHDNNDMDYTAEEYCSSSNTSGSEADDVKPLLEITSKLFKPKLVKACNLSPNRIEYTCCKICKKKTTKKFLEAHIKSWHDTSDLDENQIMKCKQPGCSAYFKAQEQLSFHLRNEHNKILRCHFCQKTFSRRLFLGRHVRTAHGKSLKNPMKFLEDQHLTPNEFKCNFCSFVTISPTKLAIHETEHAIPLPDEPSNSKLRRCPRCPYKYSTRMQRRYVVHHLRHHLSYLTGESSGACELCSKGKAYVENTKQHFNAHHNTDMLDDPTQIFKCDDCPAYYLKSFQLHRHKIRIHESKTCEICGKSFKSRHNMLGHMRASHKDYQQNPELPVPCDWPNCLKRFGTEAEVEFHKIYTHKRNPESKLNSEVCEICGKSFNSPGRLKVHMDKTHVEKNWVCNECGKSFATKQTFEIHLEYHKGPERWKFECKECGKKCFNKWKLASHMNTHTKEKPFVCQFCGEKYAHRHNWKNHLKVKHMDEEGVEEIINCKNSQRKGNYLSRKGTKKGDCVMAPNAKL